MNQSISNAITEASKVIGKTWPLYTFVASNPLSGYEDTSFQEAVHIAKKHFNANAFPTAELYRQALKNGDIDTHKLKALLEANGLHHTPEQYLNMMTSQTPSHLLNPTQKLDVIMAKWLAAFMDEGLAEWELPYKSEGFYAAWRLLAIYDSDLGTTALKEIPKTSMEALRQLLENHNSNDYIDLFTYHLAALPGWTGYINHRTQSNSDWQQEYPISLIDYLAVRLWTAKKLSIPFLPEKEESSLDTNILHIQYLWLSAWEQTWQSKLVKALEKTRDLKKSAAENELSEAQLVFCIDTRSELIRRHIEDKGNYETFGYAGFFGIAMDYESMNDGIIRKACPPILNSAYTVSEQAQPHKEEQLLRIKKKIEVSKFEAYILKRMKNILPSAFGYVEGSGWFYGLGLIGRTLLPRQLYRASNKKASLMEIICQPDINKANGEAGLPHGIPLEEKVGIVKSAFDLMGWKQFAPLVIFVGHGSHSSNNPFGSSLDCGACAASPGRHNARMLAKLANLKEVRKALADTYHLMIPENTVFIGAEHNTTTDEIVLFDSEVPETHRALVEILKANLLNAQKTATQDRLGAKANSVAIAHKKANDWGDTRPEWGLAKNAGFIIGPRSITKHINLGSRCFLHSYNWEMDTEGKALEAIMQGPMVVTQWINNHYYFSTVDNNIFGGGSKITHNITGRFGVVQGNGGDLKMGLPLQSLFDSDATMYHQPLRLSVMIQAPVSRVSEIVVRNKNIKTLLDNEWIYLLVMDPTQQNQIFQYTKSVQWVAVSDNKTKKRATQKPMKAMLMADSTM
jgi:uncharacterized protein YbcC (UPF0753/DUF2309 family)